MKKFLPLLLLAASSLTFGAEFNWQAYEPTSIANITKKWNAVTQGYQPGLTIKEPEKISLSAIAVDKPFKCNPQPLVWIFNSLNMPQGLQQTPINHCIKLKTAEGSSEFFAYIQDVLVADYIAEIRPGSNIKIFAGFLAFAVGKDPSGNFPILVVNEFQAP